MNYQREQTQEVADSFQSMKQQQNHLTVAQLQAQQQSLKIFMATLEKLNKK